MLNSDQSDKFKIHEFVVDKVYKYMYLEVRIHKGKEYLAEHDKYITGKSNIIKAFKNNRALLSYNRYAFVREIWKDLWCWAWHLKMQFCVGKRMSKQGKE